MDRTDLKEQIFLTLVRAIKDLIRKVEELVVCIRTNNPRDYLGREWLDGVQVCKLLNISKRTLQQYIRDEVFPYSKINGKNFFRPKDIEHILNQNYSNKANISNTANK